MQRLGGGGAKKCIKMIRKERIKVVWSDIFQYRLHAFLRLFVSLCLLLLFQDLLFYNYSLVNR